MGNTCNPQSQSSRGFNGLPAPFGGGKHVDPYIVARVRPRTSKGITDLLLLHLLRLDATDPSKKIFDGRPSQSSNARGKTRTEDTASALYPRQPQRRNRPTPAPGNAKGWMTRGHHRQLAPKVETTDRTPQSFEGTKTGPGYPRPKTPWMVTRLGSRSAV